MYNQWELVGNGCLSRDRNLVVGKGGAKGGWAEKEGEVKKFGSCWDLLSLGVFGCISAVVVEGACVRDCRRLGV
jgi:hypothetical protein